MSRYFSTCGLKRALSLLFAVSLLVTTGCWSEVEYKPPQEPAKHSPAGEPPVAEAPLATATPESPTDTVTQAPAPPAAETSSAVSPPAAPTKSGTELPGQLATTPDEELFGATEPSASVPLPDDAPPLVETPSPPTEESESATEQPRPLLPHEIPPAPVTLPATVPADGERNETTPPLSEIAEESPEATSPGGSRYTTTPITPDFTDDQPPDSEAPASPSSAEMPPVGNEPRPLLPHEIPTRPSTDEPAPEEETMLMEQPPADVASLPPDADADETALLTPIDPTNTRHTAWLLGSKWSLMILGEHAGAPVEEQTRLLQESQALAEALGIELPKTSPYPASQPTAAFLESALPAGRELGVAVGTKHGADETALLEVAMKSNLLLVLGEARPDLIPAVVRSVSAAAERAQLPPELVEPFAKALAGSPTAEQGDQAVYEFHRAVGEHLRTTK